MLVRNGANEAAINYYRVQLRGVLSFYNTYPQPA